MENIHIKIVSIDEVAGWVYLQFATDETLSMIDQATIHGFLPSQYPSTNLEELYECMAEFGRQTLQQQIEVQKNKLSAEQVSTFQALIGQIKAVKLKGLQGITQFENAGSSNVGYNPDSSSNVNGEIDRFRNLVLEILAEEGLIPGGVK